MIIGSFAADHVIRGTRVFEFAVRDAVEVAREGYICTVGIAPSEPAVPSVPTPAVSSSTASAPAPSESPAVAP